MTVHEDDDIIGEEGTADSNDDTIEDNTETNKSGPTPFKSRWLIPLIKTGIAETPNMSSKQMKLLLAPYIKEKFLSASLLQNVHTLTLLQVFGTLMTMYSLYMHWSQRCNPVTMMFSLWRKIQLKCARC